MQPSALSFSAIWQHLSSAFYWFLPGVGDWAIRALGSVNDMLPHFPRQKIHVIIASSNIWERIRHIEYTSRHVGVDWLRWGRHYYSIWLPLVSPISFYSPRALYFFNLIALGGVWYKYNPGNKRMIFTGDIFGAPFLMVTWACGEGCATKMNFMASTADVHDYVTFFGLALWSYQELGRTVAFQCILNS